MEEKIMTILNEMAEYLNVSQMKKLQEVILKVFSEKEAEKSEINNNEYLKMFLDAKRIEGCSDRLLQQDDHAYDRNNSISCEESYHREYAGISFRLSEN